MCSERGVIYIAFGEKAQAEARMSRDALAKVHPDWPVHIFDQPPEGQALTPASRRAKLSLDISSPYEQFLYLDADTRPRGDLSAGFAMLEDGWEMALVASTNQASHEWCWHVSDEERHQTEVEWGWQALQLQAGVMYVRKCYAMHQLFAIWRQEYERWGDQDQAALLRALRKSPIKLWILGSPYNGGALVAHLFGKARAR